MKNLKSSNMIDPNIPEIHFEMARFYILQRDYRSAVIELGKAKLTREHVRFKESQALLRLSKELAY